MNIKISEIMTTSGVGFGTSGARGLVDNMTDQVCYAYTKAFIQHLRTNKDISKPEAIAVAGDLRASTPRIMSAVIKSIKDMGLEAINCGFIPSPAVAYYGLVRGIPSIMVTGSHIPDDRNGIKFNTEKGEITKNDEAGIRNQVIEIDEGLFDENNNFIHAQQLPEINADAEDAYKNRYIDFFGESALKGITVGIYQHSGVARDLLKDLLKKMGAIVIELGRSDAFIPVDTEAIRPEDIELAKTWASGHKLDAIVSTDGDADRPLISDEQGNWLRGDAVGALCAHYLGARHAVTPVSSNTAVDKSGWFDSVNRTRIGSPYVIQGMEQLLTAGEKGIIGYEANGGFLIQDPISLNGKILNPLPTRDAVIVILCLLVSARQKGKTLSQLANELPERYTYSDRLKNIPTESSRNFLASLDSGNISNDKEGIKAFFHGQFGTVEDINRTDGLRITFESGDIVHIRPSGNAPELRCYSESDTYKNAISINNKAMGSIKQAVS